MATYIIVALYHIFEYISIFFFYSWAPDNRIKANELALSKHVSCALFGMAATVVDSRSTTHDALLFFSTEPRPCIDSIYIIAMALLSWAASALSFYSFFRLLLLFSLLLLSSLLPLTLTGSSCCSLFFSCHYASIYSLPFFTPLLFSFSMSLFPLYTIYYYNIPSALMSALSSRPVPLLYGFRAWILFFFKFF